MMAEKSELLSALPEPAQSAGRLRLLHVGNGLVGDGGPTTATLSSPDTRASQTCLRTS